ncbi:ATP-dependent DNA helicase RecG-related protein [Mucinivorans hirudinis]|uniref:ATP-dependent DNA helicase RecG-related protein n=1 Tax=Mucinivorans hirudinis TaxID=1433126 RepID=A0A060RAG8_9BACT|nr:ATP-dependent DNA helicase RecG-related protein [Mucinivorans hirudinis]
MNELVHRLIDEVKQANDELEWIEFKTNIGEMKSSITYNGLGEYISALSNSACVSNKEFAYLILGIEDTSWEIVGTNLQMSSERYQNQNYELWLRTKISPKINFTVFETDIQGKHIVVFTIPAAKGEATSFNGVAKIRVASSNTELRLYPDKLRKIVNSQDDWSVKIVENATLNDLDETAIQKAIGKFKEASLSKSFYKDVENWSVERTLDAAGITINGKITRTALVLLGKEESAHLLSPYVAQITWKLSGEQKAYQHFGIPFILNTTEAFRKIRNYQFKFFPKDELLSTTVEKFDPEVILEGLHNAVAHQDYSLLSRIILNENEDSISIINAGSFFEGKPEDYYSASRTPKRYRNRFLASAMANVGMIDSVGFGISKMVTSQKKRFFPLPDYEKSNDSEVVLEIVAKIIDENYCKLLMEKQVSLADAILLDRVQKGELITNEQFLMLKKQNLVEGRYPAIRISSKLIDNPKQAIKYLNAKGFEINEIKDGIIKMLRVEEGVKKADFVEYLLPRMSTLKTKEQNKTTIGNTLTSMKENGDIYAIGKKWYLKKK